MNIEERDFYENMYPNTISPCDTCIWMKEDEDDEPCCYCIHYGDTECPDDFDYYELRKEKMKEDDNK